VNLWHTHLGIGIVILVQFFTSVIPGSPPVCTPATRQQHTLHTAAAQLTAEQSRATALVYPQDHARKAPAERDGCHRWVTGRPAATAHGGWQPACGSFSDAWRVPLVPCAPKADFYGGYETLAMFTNEDGEVDYESAFNFTHFGDEDGFRCACPGGGGGCSSAPTGLLRTLQRAWTRGAACA
jgi:hypothetical protein